jgi:uncharacterized protein (TIGR00369 family)
MTQEEHFRALERMYRAAPINVIYEPTITVSEGEARIAGEVGPRFHHAADAVHGSVYFKMLDDAAFFAAASLEREFFVLTTSFTTYFTRPVQAGTIRAVGRVVNRGRSQLIAEAVVTDERAREIGRGSGTFVRSRIPLSEAGAYTV